MDKLVIEGGHPLSGLLRVSGSKNTALPLMAGALLADGVSTITNVPDLRDVYTFARVINVTGAKVDYSASNATATIDASNITHTEAPYELVKRMRASFYMLGALLGRSGTARVSLPGGCAWGPRPVDLHLKGLEALGASIDLDHGYVVASVPPGGLPGGSFRLQPSSVGATVNLLLAAVTARGGSRIENAAMEPDVVEFARTLQQMGARISGIGTHTLEIEGVDTLLPVTVDNCPDRIELGTFMIAAAIAGTPDEDFRILGGNHHHLGSTFLESFRQTGTGLRFDDADIVVRPTGDLQAVSIEAEIYPGFPTDLQAQWTILLACASGNGKVVDRIYGDRFKHIPELRRMGLNAIVVGNEAVVEGRARLTGAQVMSTDLRASVSLVLAGLVANGQTDVLRVYHLDRGYERIEDKLSAAGANIRRVKYDEFADPVVTEVEA